MGDSQPPPAVSQSPLIAALSTPSSAAQHDGPVMQPGGPSPGGPMRVSAPHIRPAPGVPYQRIAPHQGPPQFRQQVFEQQQVPGQRPIAPGPGPVPVQIHQQQPPMHPQPGVPMNQMPGPTIVHMPVSYGAIIDKVKLDDLIRQIDPSTALEDNVKELLMEYTDEFVGEMIDKVCTLVQHRGNKRLEVRDVELVLEMVNMMPSVPRAAVHVFGHQAPTAVPKIDSYPPTEAHKQRLQLIKKQIKKI